MISQFFSPVIIFIGPTPVSLQGWLEFLNILLTVPFIGPLLQFYHSNSIKQIVYSLGLCSHLSWITPGGCSMPALPWGAQIRTLSGTQISGTALPSDGACVRATWDLWLCKTSALSVLPCSILLPFKVELRISLCLHTWALGDIQWKGQCI